MRSPLEGEVSILDGLSLFGVSTVGLLSTDADGPTRYRLADLLIATRSAPYSANNKETCMQTDSTIEMAPAVLFEHMRQELISPGRLMSPLEVRQAVDSRDDVPPELSGWFLCGNVHATMYAKMRVDGTRLDHEVVLFPTPSGANFLVISQRAGEWEHRFVLPLVGPVVRDFACSLREKPLRLALASSREERAVISELKIARANVVEFVEAVQEVDVPIDAMFNEIAAVAVSLLTAKNIKEPAATATSGKVCVSLVASPAITFALSKRIPLPAVAAMH